MKYLLWILSVLLTVPFCFRQEKGEVLQRDEARMVRGGQTSGCLYSYGYNCTSPSSTPCDQIPCVLYLGTYQCDQGNGGPCRAPDPSSEYKMINPTYYQCMDSSQANLSPGTYEGSSTCTFGTLFCYQFRNCPTGATCNRPKVGGKPWTCSQSQQNWQNPQQTFPNQTYNGNACYFDVSGG